MNEESFEGRLNRFPKLKVKMERLLSLAENKLDGGIACADDAEERLIREVRGLGKTILEDWMESRGTELNALLEKGEEKVSKDIKKANVAYELRRC